ncbi:MAG: hypothetical protein RLZZ546_1857 [Bacteroidota bacterium]|jgi:hypothetical protein
MYKKLVYLKDVVGQQYVGVKFTKAEMDYVLKIWSSVFNQELETYKLMTFANNRDKRDGEYYHITLINVMEWNALKASKTIEELETIFLKFIDDIVFEGIGKVTKGENEAHFVVVDSPELNSIRENFGLDKKDLHITLGFDKKDVHGVSKGTDTIFKTI